MSKDVLDALFEDSTSEPPVEEMPETTPEEEPQEPQTAEAPETEPVEAGEEPGEQPSSPPEEPQQRQVPVSALEAERSKRQEAQAKLDEAERARIAAEAQLQIYQRQAAQPQAPQEPVQAPDMWQEPEKWQQYQQQQVSEAILQERMNMSRHIAVQAHGEDKVAAAEQAFQAAAAKDPSLVMRLRSDPNPYGFAVQRHEQEQVLAQTGGDLTGYREKMRAEIKAELLAEMQANIAQAQPPTPTLPPPSLASAPAAGRAGEPTAPGSSFDAVFGD